MLTAAQVAQLLGISERSVYARLRERVRDLEADKLDPNGQDPIPLGKPRKTRLGPNAKLTGKAGTPGLSG